MNHFFKFVFLIPLTAAVVPWVQAAIAAPTDELSSGPSPAHQSNTRTGDIRSMSAEERSSLTNLTVRGVVTWSSEKLDSPAVVIDDGTGGLAVYPPPAAPKGIAIGTRLEVRGTIMPGVDLFPRLHAADLRSLGTAPLPPPQPGILRRILLGKQLHDRVELNGVIQESRPINKSLVSLVLATPDGHVRAVAHVPRGIGAQQLPDCTAVVRGTVMGTHDSRQELTGFEIWCSTPEDLEITESEAPDPFKAPPTSLRSTLFFQGSAGIALHRQRITGTLTYINSAGNPLYLSQGNRAIRIATSSLVPAEIGDLVEASGFICNDDGVIAMRGAVIRKIQSGPPPTPTDVALDALFAPTRANALEDSFPDLDGSLVRFPARLVEVQQKQSGHRLLLQSGSRFIPALLNTDDGGAFHSLRPGTGLALTGIAVIRREASMEPTSVMLLLRGVSDVKILKAAPWWTRERLTLGLLSLATASLALGLWTILLRLQVRRHTLALAERTFAERSMELEQETMLRERNRIAGELHDSIQQLLAGLSFHLEANDGEPGATSEHVTNARCILVRIREEFRKCIWALRQMGQIETDPARSLRGVAALQHLCSNTQIDVSFEGPTDPIPAPVMASLSLLAREAIANAVTHGAAKRVELLFRRDAHGVTLQISDDGSGFSPDAARASDAPHFGLSNMSQRIAALGGSLDFDSQPARGTRVTARIPAAALTPLTADGPLQFARERVTLARGGKDVADPGSDRG